jgi:tRNA dimethylallyltransferase
LKQPFVLAIVGPTASGKTPVSLLLAERLSGEIISADSRQIYKYLDVGTAKPTQADRKRAKHYFVDIREPDEEYNAGQFGKEARAVVESVLKQGKLPILVGGSGLYVKSALDGLFEGPGKDPEIRARLVEQLAREGVKSLFEAVKKVDPSAAARMTEVKPRQVIRALEVYYITGRPISEFHAEQETKPDFRAIQVGLKWEREDLYDRINRRVDRMISDGLVEEVKGLRIKGYDRRLNALNTVGYKEVFDYLEGLCNLDDTITLMKQNTRRFAKRQLTWFRADRRIRWIPMVPTKTLSDAAREIEEIFERHQRGEMGQKAR